MSVRVSVVFKSVTEVMWLPAVPRAGDAVMMRGVDCDDLMVDKVVWSSGGTFVKVRDRLRGHRFTEEDDSLGGSWKCERCNIYVMSTVPPAHQDFYKDGSLPECDEKVAQEVMQS